MVNTLIVGASAAGLSCAARLKKSNIQFAVIEKQAQVAGAWRNHYHRLHLHTNRSASTLPYQNYPNNVPKYPSRLEVVAYLEQYCRDMGIVPRFNTKCLGIERKNGSWTAITNQGNIDSKNLIICTGNTNKPKMVTKPGLESFPGKVIHSSQYKDGKEFSGKKVLIIGFGNSACEIAICLHEHGAFPSMSVRSPVNVIPRDILGIPVLKLGIMMSKLPPGLADKMNAPLMSILVGNIEKYGLKKLPYGPMEQISRDRSIPLLDIGTMDLIKRGKIKIYGDIQSIDKNAVRFEQGTAQFDAIIMATGYETGLHSIMKLSQEREDDLQRKITDRAFFGKENLFFCGFYVAPTGMLREIKIESGYIARAINGKN